MKTTSRVCLLCSLILSALAAVGAESPPNDAFIKTVSALPAEQQVGAVIAKLKELNPNFDGKETHKISSGVVTELTFSTVGVTDISPVRALSWLRTLYITPPSLNQKGSLADLSPLQGMQLMWLWCFNNPITDLSPLKGMPLAGLSFGGTRVSDLSPLTGMKLQVLSFNDTVVSELGPLEGMPLIVLWCHNTKVTDLTPLKAMPLGEIKCDFVAERDAAILRGIKTLRKINDLPAATFWMRVGPVAASATPAKATPLPSRGTEAAPTLGPATTLGSVSAKEQVRRFVEEMKRLNPEFDGQVEYKTDGNRITEIDFCAYYVTNISPIRKFEHLSRLTLRKDSSGKFSRLTDLSPLAGMRLSALCAEACAVADLSPLKGMKLNSLRFSWTQVSDLSPLQGMPLTNLDFHRTKVKDLTPLQGMKLEELGFSRNEVVDLSPLKGMRLKSLGCDNNKITDLSLLKGMPLEGLWCDFVSERDTKVLRSIKTLVKINGLPAREFWKRVEAGESPQVK